MCVQSEVRSLRSTHHITDLHDLFLIKDDPIGFFQDRLEYRIGINGRSLAMASTDEILHHPAAQRSGPVKSD
jgi:hypothetical protein